MSTWVRLVKDPHIPGHDTRSDYDILKPKISGALIMIGIPTKPGPSFKCGTDVVWPIDGPPEFISLMGYKRTHYVCRHQIEAGD